MIIKIILALGILIIVYFLFKILKMIIKGITSYKKLGKKEFMNRFRKGFDEITPLQKISGELNGIIFSLIGLVIGIVVIAIFRVTGLLYLIEISLVWGAISTTWKLIKKIHQYQILKKQNKFMEDLENEII